MEWKPLKNYEKYYEISEFGDIRSFERTHETNNRFGKMIRKCGGKPMKIHSDKRYLFVELNTDKKVKKVLIHRMVYSTFVDDLKKGMVVHHKDENKTNNHYSNLEQIDYNLHNNIHSHIPWNKGIKNPDTMIENARIARLSHFKPIFKETYDLKNSGKTNKEVAIFLNISERTVIDRIKRHRELNNI